MNRNAMLFIRLFDSNIANSQNNDIAVIAAFAFALICINNVIKCSNAILLYINKTVCVKV